MVQFLKQLLIHFRKYIIYLTIILRDANRLPDFASDRIRVREGDATNLDDVSRALEDVDIVFASLSGELDKEAETIVKAMEDKEVKRLIFVTALGIYDEVPGEFGQWIKTQIGDQLSTYRKAADIIEASNLDYTIFRPAWLTEKMRLIMKSQQEQNHLKVQKCLEKCCCSCR